MLFLAGKAGPRVSRALPAQAPRAVARRLLTSLAPMSDSSFLTRPRQSRPRSPAVILAAPFPGHARQIPPAYPFISPRGPPVSHPHASTAVNLAPPPAGTLCSVAAAKPPQTRHLEGQLRPLRRTGAQRGGGVRLQPPSTPSTPRSARGLLTGATPSRHHRAVAPPTSLRCDPRRLEPR